MQPIANDKFIMIFVLRKMIPDFVSIHVKAD